MCAEEGAGAAAEVAAAAVELPLSVEDWGGSRGTKKTETELRTLATI